ncbi:MAG: zf-HC2 domain-containing protein [Acidobacteria bacterium]|nr:zf-HC2 domain-containing protein [Acidobacteriota bacterium]
MTHFDIHRGGLPPDTPCPPDLEVARFVEGTLPPDARARMVTHLAECDDCREVVATVVAAQDVDDITAPLTAPVPAATASAELSASAGAVSAPSWRRAPGTWAAALAVAAMAVIAVRVVSTPPEADPADASTWSDLAAVVGPARALEARLSGMPAHVPLRAPARSAAADTDFAARALAARLAEQAAQPAALPGTRLAASHAAAVAALLAGRADEAVTRLDAVLAETPATVPARADLLADLAAAHAALADATTRDHWTAALTAADQALALDSTHGAARFNRALALERLGRREAAIAAWHDIAGDTATASGWREEAARHARALVP